MDKCLAFSLSLIEFYRRNSPMTVYNKKKATAKSANEPHRLLQSFPSTLESHPPHVLCIPGLSLSFLAGAFPLATKKTLPFRHKGFTAILQEPVRRGDMLVAQTATRARLYCDIIMKGLEACWTVWRKGIMEELNDRLGDLERCAADAGGEYSRFHGIQANTVSTSESRRGHGGHA